MTTEATGSAVTSQPVVSVEAVSAEYRMKGSSADGSRSSDSVLRALDNVSLTVDPGEVLALVGESGSGKTTLANVITGLKAPTGGRVSIEGQAVRPGLGRARRELARSVQMVFQDPHASLSPRQTVFSLLREPSVIHRLPTAERIPPDELLAMVGLTPEHLHKYPHELSGGQARRVGIARALSLHPSLVVADEPTAGLDVSAASSVLNLVRSLASEGSTAFLLITHNLNIVSYVADRTAVMYLGQIVETGTTRDLIASPRHPYTKGLIASIPRPDPDRRRSRALLLKGEIPSAANPPSGCRFHTRCPFADDMCRESEPITEAATPMTHTVKCHHWARLPFPQAGDPG